MNAEPKQIVESGSAGASGFGSAFTRIFWTVLGPLILLGVLAYNVARPGGWFSMGDAPVALVAAAMIGCRWREQRSGRATTAYGEPSTPAHFRRYVIIVGVAAAAAWALANVLGNHVLG